MSESSDKLSAGFKAAVTLLDPLAGQAASSFSTVLSGMKPYLVDFEDSFPGYIVTPSDDRVTAVTVSHENAPDVRVQVTLNGEGEDQHFQTTRFDDNYRGAVAGFKHQNLASVAGSVVNGIAQPSVGKPGLDAQM